MESETVNSTRLAMDGSMTFQEALAKRLDIIRPSIQQAMRLQLQ